MNKITVLWVDDEIDLLKPHVIFLKDKGYDVLTANNGDDALAMIADHDFDIVFLDEQMPGLSGLEILASIKNSRPNLPVVIVTKSEEENLMDEAIGSKISDYLIKPVSPRQILLSIKKNIDSRRLVSEKTNSGYQQEFRNIGMALNDRLSHTDWVEIYKKIVFWELGLEESDAQEMDEILKLQKSEANRIFSKFAEQNYLNWLNGKDNAPPVLSHTLFGKKIAPVLEENLPVFLVVIDNLRYDQWKVIQPIITEYFRLDSEELYYSILPTATQFSRNAIFAGLMPSEIEKKYPNLWANDGDEGGKNMHEEQLLAEQLKRLGKNVKFSYTKVSSLQGGKKLADNISNLTGNDLNVIVYNFVDMLSHARTEMEMIKELADDEAAYRSLTLSWFEHSPLLDSIRKMAEKKAKLIITTDHGTIRVKEPSKVIGDRGTTTNLRYKEGKMLTYQPNEVFQVRNPSDAFLPKPNFSSSYIFAKDDRFFVYPNNYNHFVNLYRNSFQHGGISLEEMLIPFVVLSSK